MRRMERIGIKTLVIFILLMLACTIFAKTTRSLTLPRVSLTRLQGAAIGEGESRQTFYSCLPISALSQGEESCVYVVQEKESVLGKSYIVHKQSIRIEAQDNWFASVDGNLETDALIVADSNKALNDGDEVSIMEEADASIHMVMGKSECLKEEQLNEIRTAGMDYCVYRKRNEQKVKGEDIAVCTYKGTLDLLGIKLVDGAWPQGDSDCLVDSGTCKRLWNTTKGAGKVITIQKVCYNVCGVFDSEEPLLLYPENEDDIAYSKAFIQGDTTFLQKDLALDWEKDYAKSFVPGKWSQVSRLSSGIREYKRQKSYFESHKEFSFEKEFCSQSEAVYRKLKGGTGLGLLLLVIFIVVIIHCDLSKRVLK